MAISTSGRNVARKCCAPLASQPAGLHRFMIGGTVPGYDPFEPLVARYPARPIADQAGGAPMLYSSGTTGRPKGVKRMMTGEPFDTPSNFYNLTRRLYGFDENTVYLSPAPLYHAAPATDRR